MRVAYTAFTPLHLTSESRRKSSQSQTHTASAMSQQESHSCMVIVLVVLLTPTARAGIVITEMHKPRGQRGTFLKQFLPYDTFSGVSGVTENIKQGI